MTGLAIAYLLKKFPRLSETFILNEILAQERLGTRIHVFSRRPPDDEPRHPQLRDLSAAVEVLDPSAGLEPWVGMFDTRPEQRALLAQFGEVVRGMTGYGHPRLPALLGEALFLLRRTRELGIEHVHVHFATDSAITAMLLHELGGPSYSVTAHAKDIYRTAVDTHLLARVIAGSAFTVTVCDANVRWLEGRLPAESVRRVRRLYNGIDLAAFSAPTSPREESHVLSVGRMVPKKGFDVLVRALAILRDRGSVFRATLVGEGEDRARIESLAREYALSDRLQFTGALDQAEVRKLMARATVFCQPCLVGEDGNRDALPTTLIESIAMGLPCISTPVTGIPEILDHGGVGVLVPENDPAATADALAALLSDPARRSALARAARARAEAYFDGNQAARTLRSWFVDASRSLACA